MSPLLFLVSLLSLVSLSAAASLSFSNVAPATAFPVREYPACAQTNPTVGSNPTIYFFGGFSVTGSAGSYTDNYYNDAWSSTNFGQTWTQLNAAAAFPKQAWNSAVSTPNGLIFIGGGNDTNAQQNNAVWISQDGATWSVSTAAAPFDARENAGIANIPGTGNIMVALGNTKNDVFVDDIWLSTDGRGQAWTQQCSGTSTNLCPLIVQNGNETGQLHGPALVGLYSGSWVLMGGYGSYANGTTSWVSNQVAYSSNNFQSYTTYAAPWSPRAQQRAVVDTDNYVYVYGGVYDLPTGTTPSQVYYNYFTDVWFSTNAASGSPNWQSLGSFASSLGSAAYSGVSYTNNPNANVDSSLFTNGAIFNPCFAFRWSGSQKQLVLYTGVYAGFRQVNPQATPAWPGVYVGNFNNNGAGSVAVSALSVAAVVMAAVALML